MSKSTMGNNTRSNDFLLDVLKIHECLADSETFAALNSSDRVNLKNTLNQLLKFHEGHGLESN